MKFLNLVLLSLSQVTCSAFIYPTSPFLQKPISPRSSSSISSRQSVHLMAKKNANENNDNKEDNLLSQRTDINQFLTQRTFQTFIHLLKQFRDPHTGNWIEDFLGSKNLLHFHGTGAICMNTFPKWDSALKEMTERDPDVIIIEIEATNAARGLSKNNPFREKEVSLLFHCSIIVGGEDPSSCFDDK